MADHEIEVRFSPYPLVAHSDIDNADCCGCLYIEPRGQEAALICNEYAAVIRIVPADQAIDTLAALASTEMCSQTCPQLRNPQHLPGLFSHRRFCLP